ncbi:MAG TPA: DUF4476 domain-containing protein [Chitinophagaceae bacterium]|jgi:hypothetical protein|nr:DUF4476 domain-containing protein [Chitinophagaceae bacterium]
MKKSILCLFILLAGCGAFSQRVYFVYLQTEQEQPFFVKLNNKVFSSAASGYVILSKLYDSTYDFSIGFPQNKWPEQHFSLKVGAKDHGYLVKNFGDKGWGLFDLQTMAVQMAATAAETNDKSGQTNVSPFTDILAKATGDSTLKQKPEEIKAEEKKTSIADQVVVNKKDTSGTKSIETSSTEPKNKNEQPVVKNDEIKSLPAAPYKRSTVIRKSESSTTTGFSLTYIDDYGTGKDTISIFIPEPVQSDKKSDAGKKEDVKFLDIVIDSTEVPVNTAASNNQNKDVSEKKLLYTDSTVVKSGFKNNCVVTANDKDFFDLRKIMAALNGNEEMIDAAKKYFKGVCFSTAQIKNLSTLFLDDAGKYSFFDAAYKYVSDIENFASLQSELKDPYYINRFKAMLRN